MAVDVPAPGRRRQAPETSREGIKKTAFRADIVPVAPACPHSLSECPTPRAHEAGFTLVEMMVVAVLLLVVLTMTMRFVLDVMHREQEGVISKRANERNMVALDQMGQDFRATVSRDRATGGGLGLDDLDFVSTGYLPGGADRRPFIDEKLDIVSASPWQIRLMVPSGAGTSCVTYQSSPAQRGQITRTESTTCPATGSNTTARNIVLGPAPTGVTITPPFSFTQLSQSASCSVQDVARNASWDALTGQGDMRTFYRLASIKLDLRSFAQAGASRASSKVTTEYVFRSRMSAPYRRALGGGCGE